MFAKLRTLFRFDLATLICFAMALNFMVFVNWQMRVTDFYEVREQDRPVFRSIYIVGFPTPFLKLTGIKNRIFSDTSVETQPVAQVLSAKSAAISISFNLVLALLLTGAILAIRQEYWNRRRPGAEDTPPAI